MKNDKNIKRHSEQSEESRQVQNKEILKQVQDDDKTDLLPPKTCEVAIIGAGVAGISCAVQLKRQGIEPLVFEKSEVGGLIRNASLVENYPGFPQGLSGRELAANFGAHLEAVNITPVCEEVINVFPLRHSELVSESVSLQAKNDLFKIQTQNSEYLAKFLVVASGTVPKKINIEPVFYEISELYKENLTGKTVAIIGSGDAAFDYALNLADNSPAKEIFILNRSSKTKCLDILKERVLANTRINYIENEEPSSFSEETLLCKSGLKLEADYLLAAIGREANTAFFDESVKEAENLFYVGDVKNGDLRQTAIAAGDGIKAAMEISLYQ